MALWPVFLLEAVVIVILNGITIATIAMTSGLHRLHNYLLVSIAVADFLVGAVSVTLYTAILADSFNAQHNWWVAQDTFFAIASMFGLASLSVERMCVVSWSWGLQSTRTRPVYAVFIGLPWVLALISAVTHASLEGDNRGDFYFSVVTVVISLALILISNVLIWVKVRAAAAAVVSQHHELERSLAITASLVVMLSLLAWLPFVICNIIIVECRGCYDRDVMRQALYFTKLLHYGNSLVNPIVYVIKLHDFRKAAWALLACNRRAAVPREDMTLDTMEA